MKKLILMLAAFAGMTAFADEIVDLNQAEVQAVYAFAKCSDLIESKDYSVVRGRRGTFRQGIVYWYELEDSAQVASTLEVRWTAATRTFDCKIFDQ